ncbi:MAG: GcvH, partial [Anaerolineales bacterium]|nr:GcvH [Anaerolineales bacterium]
TPKEVGKPVKKGKSAGTVESGKWVGPVTAPVNGTISEINTVLKSKPSLLNSDPYGEGWFLKIKPDNWEADSTDLVTGGAGIAAYQKFLNEQGIDCAK